MEFFESNQCQARSMKETKPRLYLDKNGNYFLKKKTTAKYYHQCLQQMIGYKWYQAHRRTRVRLIESEVSSKFLFLIFKLVVWHQKRWIKLLELT